MGAKSYRDLLVWQKAIDLVQEIYTITNKFPRSEEFGLKSQMRRAAISIPSNIAEGQGRRYPKMFHEFVCIAMGSLYELETQLELAIRTRILSEADCDRAWGLCHEVGKMLFGLSKTLSQCP